MKGSSGHGTPVRDEGSVTYSAATESGASRDTDEEPSAFAARAMPEATLRGFAPLGAHNLDVARLGRTAEGRWPRARR
ncbi:MAG: hypothetical protein HYY06_16535 [Deltaproteobacteria bacterium]|nr:hypothetical protein [Deltaproteobacteria bacterium]